MSKFKDQERILKAAREKNLVMLQGNPHKIISRFFSRNFAGHKGVAQYIQSAERKNFQLRILCQEKLTFRIEEERELQDKQKLKEFITSKLTLQEMLKRLL